MKFGFIGTNFITDAFISGGQKIHGFEPWVVCSRSADKGKDFASKHGMEYVVNSVEELCSFKDVESVHVASPNICHFSQAKQLLEHHINVLVEKPAVLTENEFDELVTIAVQNRVVIMEGMRTIHTPGFHTIEDTIKEIGTVRRFSMSYCQYSRRYDNFKNGIIENAFNPTLGNGSLMDVGAYCFGTLTALFGCPGSIKGNVIKLHNGIDVMGTVICTYDEMLADLSFGKISDTRRFSEIQGENGTILFYPPTNPSHVELIIRNGDRTVLLDNPDEDFYGISYEIDDFIKFANNPDDDEWKKYAQNTKNELHLMDTARSLLGIDFEEKVT